MNYIDTGDITARKHKGNAASRDAFERSQSHHANDEAHVLEIIEEQGLLENARLQGERLLARLRVELADDPNVLVIRGQGLMIGIELAQPIRDLTLIAARDHRLLINVTRGKTIRLLPPLTIDEREVEMIVRGVGRAVKAA